MIKKHTMPAKFSFPLTEALELRIKTLIEEVRATEQKRQYALKAFQIVSDLSDIGLDYFFVQTLKRAGFGRIKIMAIENALSIGKRAILTITKKMMKNMSDEQIAVIIDLFEECICSDTNQA